MSSPRILVVDDEADIRGLLSEILAVRAARSGGPLRGAKERIHVEMA